MSSRKEVEKIVKDKAVSFAAVFNTRDGQKVLQAMKDEFCGTELRANTPHDTYYNLGRRDAVVYIEQMIKYSERENETE